jgi:hypothetical protein
MFIRSIALIALAGAFFIDTALLVNAKANVQNACPLPVQYDKSGDSYCPQGK